MLKRIKNIWRSRKWKHKKPYKFLEAVPREGMQDRKFVFVLNGQRYYILSDISSYPPERKLNAISELKGLELNFSEGSLKAFLGKIREAMEASAQTSGPKATQAILRPYMDAIDQAIERIDALSLPRIACRVLAWLIFTEEESITKPPSAQVVQDRARLFWDKKKAQMLGLVFSQPMMSLAKIMPSQQGVGLESLKSQMVLIQALMDSRSLDGIAD